MKLHTKPASFRAQKVLVTSVYSGVSLSVVTDSTEKSLKSLTPFVKLPLLETSEGGIAESTAIVKYIAAKGSKAGQLLGADAFAQAQINSWMEFCANDIEVPATVVCYPIIGWMALHNEAFEKAKKDLNVALTTLEQHLKTKTFLVGERISVADITVATALLLPFKLVIDEKNQKTFPCTTRWFTTCVNQPEFIKVVGETVLAKTALVPKDYKAPATSAAPAAEKKEKAPKKEKAKKEDKKPEPKEEDEEAEEPLVAPEKKEKHYCESLPKPKMVLDAWKREYSNAKDCYQVMPWFWENFDSADYCLYRADYNYNDELQVSFMVSNLCGGFIQRCDEIRKYAFGVVQILKKGSEMRIPSVWLFRGDSNKLMMDANDDASSYTWTKLDPTDESVKKMVADMWCAGEEIEGWTIEDCKVFK